MTRRSINQFYDDFIRSNTPVGAGNQGGPVTGPLWTPGAYPIIQSNTLTSASIAEGGNGNGYANLDMLVPPIKCAGTFSFDNDGGAAAGSVVIDISEVFPPLTPGIHTQVTVTGCGVILWDRGSGHIYPAWNNGWNGVWTSPIALDGTIYSWSVEIIGNTLTLVGPDGSIHHITHPGISVRYGQYVYYQAGWNPATPDSRPRWHSATIDRPVNRTVTIARVAAIGRTPAGIRPAT